MIDLPAWISHPGILILNKISKKKRFCGLALVWGSLTPDLEFIFQIAWAYYIYGDFWTAYSHHGQSLFHSIFGLFITVPLAILLTIITSNFIKRVLSSRFFSFLKIENLEQMEHTLKNPSMKVYTSSAAIGVLSAIFFDFFTHVKLAVLYPFYPEITNPLIYIGFNPWDVFITWILMSIILFVFFIFALYKYSTDRL